MTTVSLSFFSCNFLYSRIDIANVSKNTQFYYNKCYAILLMSGEEDKCLYKKMAKPKIHFTIEQRTVYKISSKIKTESI